MKYEMIFGDESLADKFTNENSVFIVCKGHGVYFEFESGSAGVNHIANSCSIGDSFYMRRIIAEPKQWTLEDKKAGRLPDVGCEVMVIYTKMVCTVNAICKIYKSLSLTFPDGSLGMVELEDIDPIETPAEKAQRERNAWAKKASQFIDDELDCVNIVGEHVMRRFYNALKSGELPMPKKGGE